MNEDDLDLESRSGTFRAFHEDFFGGSDYMRWHDGLNLSNLLALKGNERALAEQLLIEHLSIGNPYPQVGLGAIKSQAAIPHLKKLANESQGTVKVNCAVALWKIAGNPEAIDLIIDVLGRDPAWSSRLDAAIALRKFPMQRSVDALEEALVDPEYLVRYHACSSLLVLCGEDSGMGVESHPLAIAIMSEDPEEIARTANEVRQLVAERVRFDEG